MEQSIKITLNKTTFTLNIGAYTLLNNYVTHLKENFKNEPDTLFDLEARIAELLTIYLSASGQNLVTEIHVTETIKTIGTIEELGEGTQKTSNNSKTNYSTNKVKTKLYRNPTNQSLGGVCSGIGYYLNVDSSIVRLVFVIASFFFGTSVFIYLLLWFFVPKASNVLEAKVLVDFEINNPNKLLRNEQTKVIAGVCAGLGIHLGIPIWVIRLLFVIGVFVFGFSFLGYLLAWLIIPINSGYYQSTNQKTNEEYVHQNQEQVGIIRFIFNIIIASLAIILLGILVISFFFTAGLFGFFTHLNLFEFLSETIPFDENLSLIITGVLLVIFSPILFLLAVIAKYAFKAQIQFRYAGFGLVFLFFLGIGLLVYTGIILGTNYYQSVDSTNTENKDLSQNDTVHFIINELNTGKQIDFFTKNEFKIQLCDSGIFVPIDYGIDNTLENKSTYTVKHQFKGAFGGEKTAPNNQIIMKYKLEGDSVIFPSHYFIPKPYKFKFQSVNVKFYLKENTKFYANKTAQVVFGLLEKNDNPEKFWFEINEIDNETNWNKKQSKFERKQEEKEAEIELKLEEKETELEQKADNL